MLCNHFLICGVGGSGMVGDWLLPWGGLFSGGEAGSEPPYSPTRRGAPKGGFMICDFGFVIYEKVGCGFIL